MVPAMMQALRVMMALLLVMLAMVTTHVTAAGLDVAINKADGSYSINVDGNTWLKSGTESLHSSLLLLNNIFPRFGIGPTSLMIDGTLYSSATKTLTIVNSTQFNGVHHHRGAFVATQLTWRATVSSIATTHHDNYP